MGQRDISALVAVVVAACGSSSEAPSTPPAAAPPTTAPAAKPRAPAIERRLYPIRADASSFLESEHPPFVQYHPNYAIDGDPKTAWNEGAPNDGPGEWVRFTVTKQQSVSRVRLRILDGFHYSDAIYRANARAKTVDIRLLPDGKPRRQVLDDKMAWQEIALATETPVLDGIEIKVVDVYPGAKFKDLAISELEIYATSESPEQPDVEKRQLGAILAWKKEQRALAELASVPAVELAPGDPATMPDAARSYIERARAVTIKTMSSVAISARNKEVSAEAIQSCYQPGAGADCLAPLYTTAAMVTRDDPRGTGCFDSALRMNGPSELAVARCSMVASRSAQEESWTGLVLEYDDESRLRVVLTPEGHVTWLEWGRRDGKPQITGGAWMDPSGSVRALIVAR
jgi:hypothetical protein